MSPTVWTRQDCPICGRTADVKWSQISSFGNDVPSREDPEELDCPTGHHLDTLELNKLLKHRGPSGRLS